jgi:hypothetical protein
MATSTSSPNTVPKGERCFLNIGSPFGVDSLSARWIKFKWVLTRILSGPRMMDSRRVVVKRYLRLTGFYLWLIRAGSYLW